MHLLEKLLQTSSPSGTEESITSIIQNELHGLYKTEYDSIGNLYILKGKGNQKIMITAHCDEVGFQITAIDNNGFARIRRIGGADKHVLPGSVLVTHIGEKSVFGIIGKKSPHSQNEQDRTSLPDLSSNLFVDFGYSSKNEAERYIHVGQTLSFASNIYWLNENKRLVSKALDNKLGVFVMLESLKLVEINNDIQIIGVATTQEEISGKGAYISSSQIQPDILFVIDCGVATDIPCRFDWNYPELNIGKGPAICINADNSKMLVNTMKNVAELNDIPYQLYPGNVYSGGNEASIVWNSSKVKVANIFIPIRYMHSNCEMCEWSDVDYTIKLLTSTIQTIINQTVL